MTFRSVRINEWFDFIKPDSIYNSFYLRCQKISSRKYRDETGVIHHIGTINAEVYNVGNDVVSPAEAKFRADEARADAIEAAFPLQYPDFVY